MSKIAFYLKRIYRLALSFVKQEEIVWSDLKKLHTNLEWKSGVYEKDKYIETIFEIGKEQIGVFHYIIYDSSFHCRVKIVEHYPLELTTDLFILATHFNNVLNNGVVIVNVHSHYVEYQQKRDLLIPLLYSGEIHGQITRHYNTARDIYAAFQRLIYEHESPAIIIADLLNENKKEDEKDE